MVTSSPSPFATKPHMVIFPFMSKGHTIPLLNLAWLLHGRGVAITIFTTPGNHRFISQFLPGAAAADDDNNISIVDLPFPNNIPGVPPGVESTDNFPSMSLFLPFANGIKQMQPRFEEALERIHSKVSCIISDSFLSWTLESASKFRIPRLSFNGMGYYSGAVCRDAGVHGLLSLYDSNDEPFTLVEFPQITLTRNYFDDPFDKKDPSGPYLDFVFESVKATGDSHGLLVNSFYEFEQPFADYMNRAGQLKIWSIGPLCLAQPEKTKLSPGSRPKWMDWLDKKFEQGSPVLYVAFGTQARISPEQLHEIALGLDESKVSFLWVVRTCESEESDGLGGKISERGLLVKEWVDQMEILKHPAVQGFLSHCGWNSVLDGVCAEVPILAWPMMADQFLNAKMVAEEVKIGLKVNTCNGSPKGFVTWKSLKDTVIQLMESEKGKELKEKMKEVSAAAKKAMAEGGSSWHNLNNLIAEVHGQKKLNASKLSY